MGTRQSLRSSLVYAAVATAVWALVSVRWSDTTPRAALVLAPVFFVMIFFTMRITNRLTEMIAKRFVKPPAARGAPGRAAPEPSSERPEHAQRRRSTRRSRGGPRRRR